MVGIAPFMWRPIHGNNIVATNDHDSVIYNLHMDLGKINFHVRRDDIEKGEGLIDKASPRHQLGHWKNDEFFCDG